MKLKKIISISVACLMSATALVGCSNNKASKSKDETIKVGMVTDVAGVNDQSFNQSAWEGFERAEKELGVKATYLESKQDSDYVTNIESFIDQDIDIIVGVGEKLGPAIKQAAKDYPDQKFALVDSTYEDGIPKNVKTILFSADQSSYLAGLVAGKMTKTNNVGFIGGMKISVIKTYENGFVQGVKAANPDVKIQSQYANSFSDQAKGKSIANTLYSNGADIIFTAAGDVGTGAIEAAKEQNKFAIGVDRDQNSLAPNNVITSAMKRVDVGVFELVKELKEGNFKGGENVTYGLKEGAVGIPDSSSKLVDKDILDYVKSQEEKLKTGEIKIPSK